MTKPSKKPAPKAAKKTAKAPKAAAPATPAKAPKAAAKAPKAPKAPPLFEGDTPTPASISWSNSSGPVAPPHQFHEDITITAGPDGLKLHIEARHDWKDGKFQKRRDEDQTLSRADYEALWADLFELGLLEIEPSSSPARAGGGLVALDVQLGDLQRSFEIRHAELRRGDRPDCLPLIDRVRMLMGDAPPDDAATA